MWVNAGESFRMPHRTARFLPNIGRNDSPSQQFFEYQGSLQQRKGAHVESAFLSGKPVVSLFGSVALNLCLAKTRSAFEMNDIRGGRLTRYMDDIQP